MIILFALWVLLLAVLIATITSLCDLDIYSYSLHMTEGSNMKIVISLIIYVNKLITSEYTYYT